MADWLLVSIPIVLAFVGGFLAGVRLVERHINKEVEAGRVYFEHDGTWYGNPDAIRANIAKRKKA